VPNNADLVARSFEAIRALDIDGLLRLYDPDIEFMPLTGTRVDSGGYHGHDGVRAYLAEAAELWDVMEPEGHSFTETGDTVIVAGHCRVRGRLSGAESDPACAWVIRVRDGLIVSHKACSTYDEALEVAGVDAAGDQFVLDTPPVRSFVADIRSTIAAAASPEEACEAIRPRFAELLADPDWLPAEYQAAAPESGMGGGIGQWLLYRAGDGSLSLFSLVVPSASETPIHDHLAWGLVGLYRGAQDEEIYAEGNGSLELVEKRSLGPGDFYVLIPPRDDIHRVRTTSAETSVSIHLLTNDTGCVWRHAYDPVSGEARPFRSGYVNVACEDDRRPDRPL
jgi:3-mercaptopropionate dioxygenase